jgi:hypothetical protein
MDLAIKLLYVGMSFLCENVVRVEQNWMNRFMCSRHCAKNAVDGHADDDSESFDDFMKKINNNNNNNNNSLVQRSPPRNFGTLRNASETVKSIQAAQAGQPLNSAQVSTLNFPNPNQPPLSAATASLTVNTSTSNNHNGNTEDVDHEKIKKLIDKLYMKTIVERSEEDNEDDEDEEISLTDDKIYKKASTVMADSYVRNNARNLRDKDFTQRSKRNYPGSRNMENDGEDDDEDTQSNRMFPRIGSEAESKQIIFSRGMKDIETMIPQPN